MDFKALLHDSQSQLPIEPRALYEQLPNKQPGYGYLRDVQAQVLTAWHERRGQRDLVIKVNTGGGKTIDGLVILQSYLNEGLGPALYVAPGKYLQRQVLAEAAKLGIATVTDPDDLQYVRSEAIAVINAYKLFNGRTVFSEHRIGRPAAPIGAVVIDDAHAALPTVNKQLSLSISDDSEVFGEIIELFRSDLEQQSPDSLADILDADHEGALLRVPFWAVRSKAERLRVLLRKESASGDGELYWQWPAVRDVLALSRVVITQTAVTVSPPCPPTGHATSFAQAQRRVYLSATLADDSVLVTDFGADPNSLADPITPLTAGDIGERMILAPQELNPSISSDAIRAEIVELSQTYNTVVIVPSDRSTDRWSDVASEVPKTTEEIDNVVARLKSGTHVGLTVLTNKYDGIDLPQDACRVLVLDGLPGAFSGEERLEALLTSRESGVDDRQVQRIEQGMGRGVRSNEDHCVVFLIGPRLAQLTADPRTLRRFSPATQAQLKLSRSMAASMNNKPLSEIIATARQALERDADWVKLAKLQLGGIEPQRGSLASHAAPRRNAFKAACAGDYPTAAKLLSEALGADLSIKEKGWLREQHAIYLDQVDPVHAQEVLRVARSENSHVTRPLTPLDFRMLDSADSQVVAASTNLTSMFGNGSALQLGFEAILEDLLFDPLRTEEFEAALLQLGALLGLGSQRPEHELGKGPDNLWALEPGKFWVIEAKSGATSTKIGKRDAGQLGQAIEWFDTRYAKACERVPVMIHPSDTLYDNATAVPGMQVLTEKSWKTLTDNVRKFGAALAVSDHTRADNVANLLAGHRLTVADLPSYLRAVKG